MLQVIASAVQKSIFCPHTWIHALDNAHTKQNVPHPPCAYAPAEGCIDAGKFDRLMAHGCGRETNTHASAVFVWVFVSVALLYLG